MSIPIIANNLGPDVDPVIHWLETERSRLSPHGVKVAVKEAADEGWNCRVISFPDGTVSLHLYRPTSNSIEEISQLEDETAEILVDKYHVAIADGFSLESDFEVHCSIYFDETYM